MAHKDLATIVKHQTKEITKSLDAVVEELAALRAVIEKLVNGKLCSCADKHKEEDG